MDLKDTKFIAMEVRGKACTRCMFKKATYAQCCEVAAMAVRSSMPDCDDPCRKGWTIVYQAPEIDPGIDEELKLRGIKSS